MKVDSKESNKKTGQNIKTPLDIILTLAQSEIKNHVSDCMRMNGIPPVLMFYLLKSIELDIYEMKDERLCEDFSELQKHVMEKQEE